MWIRKCDAELDCKCFDKTCSLGKINLFTVFSLECMCYRSKLNSGLKFLTQVDYLFPLSPSPNYS